MLHFRAFHTTHQTRSQRVVSHLTKDCNYLEVAFINTLQVAYKVFLVKDNGPNSHFFDINIDRSLQLIHSNDAKKKQQCLEFLSPHVPYNPLYICTQLTEHFLFAFCFVDDFLGSLSILTLFPFSLQALLCSKGHMILQVLFHVESS